MKIIDKSTQRKHKTQLIREDKWAKGCGLCGEQKHHEKLMAIRSEASRTMYPQRLRDLPYGQLAGVLKTTQYLCKPCNRLCQPLREATNEV